MYAVGGVPLLLCKMKLLHLINLVVPMTFFFTSNAEKHLIFTIFQT